jgi:hypothetical protein
MTSFRERMKKQKGSLKKRHNSPVKSGRYPTFFKKSKIPDGIPFFRSKEGEHIIDIIPFKAGPDMPLRDDNSPVTEEGKLDYIIDIEVHMNIGTMKQPFVCPYQNFGLPCPICEYMNERRLDKDEWKAIKTSRRAVYLIWVHDSVAEEKKGIQIFHASHYLMEEKLESISKIPKGGGYVDFSNYDDGKSIVWEHKGTGRDTKYVGHKLIDREVPIPDSILDKSFSLDSIIDMHPSYDEIYSTFHSATQGEEGTSDNADDEEERKPKKKKKKKLKSGKKEKTKKRSRKLKKSKEPYVPDDDIPF